MQLPGALAKLVAIAPARVVVSFTWLLQFVQEMKRRETTKMDVCPRACNFLCFFTYGDS